MAIENQQAPDKKLPPDAEQAATLRKALEAWAKAKAESNKKRGI